MNSVLSSLLFQVITEEITRWQCLAYVNQNSSFDAQSILVKELDVYSFQYGFN